MYSRANKYSCAPGVGGVDWISRRREGGGSVEDGWWLFAEWLGRKKR